MTVPIESMRPPAALDPPAPTIPARPARRHRLGSPAVAIVCVVVSGLALGLLGSPRTAAAQENVARATTGAPLPRWDVAGVFGWRGVRTTEQDSPSSTWDHRGTYVGIGGYYWTTHLKTEVEVGGVTPSTFQTYRQFPMPGQSFTAFVRTEHDTVGVPVSGRLLYQFGENAWGHLFAGAGVAFDWTRDRRHTPFQTQSVRRPDGQFDQVVVAEESTQTTHLRQTSPVLITGFKAYASAQGFIRGELLWTVGVRDQRYVSWRVGFGTDF